MNPSLSLLQGGALGASPRTEDESAVDHLLVTEKDTGTTEISAIGKTTALCHIEDVRKRNKDMKDTPERRNMIEGMMVKRNTDINEHCSTELFISRKTLY